MDDKHAKLRIKVGLSEFEAEGPADLVQKQYQEFLAALTQADIARTSSPAPALPLLNTPGQPAEPPPSHSDSADLKRVFSDQGPLVSLLALPKTEDPDADALLLLVYGYQELRPNDYPVSGVRLMQSAKQSGLHQVDRIDRTIDAH